MARKIDTRWYDIYLSAKAEFSRQGSAGTLTSVAQALGMNPKTLTRMFSAGCYLERHHPGLPHEAVGCSYVHMELLEKIARIDAAHADALLPPALNNDISIAQLSQALDDLRGDNPQLAHTLNARSNKRRTAKALLRDVEACLRETSGLFFGARGGAILKSSTFPAFQAPNFVVQTASGTVHSLIFCKVGADTRSTLAVAMDLYDLAHVRRSMGPNIWIIFPERSGLLDHLAELALWLGGSPFNGSWLYLAHVEEVNGTPYLRVLFEQEYGLLLGELQQGRGHIDPKQLRWQGSDLNKVAVTATVGIGYEFSLPTAQGARTYSQALTETLQALTEQGIATNAEKGLLLEDRLGL